MSRTPARRIITIALIGQAILVLSSTLFAQISDLKIGDPAPKLELTAIRFYDFRIDEHEITRANAGFLYDKTRLSDFRGKRSLALFFRGRATEGEAAFLEEFQRLHELHGHELPFLLVYSDQNTELSTLELMQRANTFVTKRDLSVPCLVANTSNQAKAAESPAMSAKSAHFLLIARDGTIVARASAESFPESPMLMESAILVEIEEIKR